jgi:tetratricopeptide (TPR) repeat protein/tRNA A-37 threonylcarbamoyl transferase component Bud32
MTAAADRHLLFGLLALQNGLIDQGQLVAAFQAWVRDKARPLADHLTARGDLDDDDRAAVEALAARHLKRHGGDAERSLAAIPAGRFTREALIGVGDPQIDVSMAHVGSRFTEIDGDPDRTATYSVGTATSDGQRFRVLRPHARGGLGAVFVALDTELHREVALKQILESHADEPSSRQRFLLEAEVTGGLEHPGIVPVYGLGSYGDGRPFYAMRFIRGDSLKEAIEAYHADEALKNDPGGRSLEFRKLLRRFLDVCNAIDYAHSRGVLHRDIKPGNIIVGRHGETLVVDWGLAKATGQSDPASGERTLVPSSASGSAETLPGSALGTPAYMSPEQAEGDLDRLGPRSDVYSLGATLYCLLTGKPPFTGDPLDVIPRVQRGDFRPPRALDPTIDPALEAICLKAMALRPDDRYGSCRALAEDVERWMADEPVAAWREPFGSRARRWARRNRTAVAAAVVTLFSGVVGLGAVATVQALANGRLRDANAATNRALADTRQSQAETRAALEQSEESRRQAEAVRAFLVEAFRSPDPSRDGREIKVVEILDRAGERLERGFSGSQATKGSLLHTLGVTYYSLGLYDRAVPVLTQAGRVREEALGADHPDTLKSRYGLAVAYYSAGRLREAIALAEATLKVREMKLGLDHPDTLRSRNSLASAYIKASRLSEAIALFEATLRLFEAKLGPDHPETLQGRMNLANAYGEAGRSSEAIAMHEATLKLYEATLGPDHPDTLFSRNNLAANFADRGRLSEAIALNEGTLKRSEAKLGPDHPITLIRRTNLAEVYRHAGRLSEAVGLVEATLKSFEASLGPDHPETLRNRNVVSEIYESLGRTTEAEALYRNTLVRRRKADGPESPFLASDLASLGGSLLNQLRWSEAEPLVRESMAIFEKAMPDEWPRYLTMSLLGGSLLGQGKYAEAEPLVVEGYEGMKAREAKIPAPRKSILSEAAVRVVRLYEEWGKPDQAADWKIKLGLRDLPADVFDRP